MNTYFKSLLFVIISLISVANVYGQYDWTPATIHLKNGKFLTGEVKLSKQTIPSIVLGKDKAYYRKSENATKQKLSPDEIDTIVFTISYEVKQGGEKTLKTRKATYITTYLKKRKKRLRFVEVIVDGKVKLIGRTVDVSSSTVVPMANSNGFGHTLHNFHSFNTHNELYTWKKNELPYEINKVGGFVSFKRRASKYFKDCSTLVEKLKNKTFKRKNLVEIVNYYNEHCGSK